MTRPRTATFYAVWWARSRILKVGVTVNEYRRFTGLTSTGGDVKFMRRRVPLIAERDALRALRARYKQGFATEQEATRLLPGGRGFTETFHIPEGGYVPAVLVAIRELDKYGVRAVPQPAVESVDDGADGAIADAREVHGGDTAHVRERPGAGILHTVGAPADVPARRRLAGAVRGAPPRAGGGLVAHAVRGGRRRGVPGAGVAVCVAQEGQRLHPTSAGGPPELRRRVAGGSPGRGERGREGERERRRSSVVLLPSTPAQRHQLTMPRLWDCTPRSGRVLAQAGYESHRTLRGRRLSRHPQGVPTAHTLRRGGTDPRPPVGYVARTPSQGYAENAYPWGYSECEYPWADPSPDPCRDPSVDPSREGQTA